MPCVGTNVEFTLTTPEHTLPMSSSGGELFGRLMTRKSHETLFICGGLPCHSRTYDIALPPMWWIQFAIAVFAS